ncbi:MAG TPA: hypothetical protein GX731_09530, partial [Clostridiales bacterium]|nr:hypothetical protein [Clostridiales bacterium]
MNKKLIYISPSIGVITIDRELVLLQTSEGTIPGPPDPIEPAGNSNSSTTNKFNENPF